MPITKITTSDIADSTVTTSDISPTAGITSDKIAGGNIAQIDVNNFNIGVLGFKMAVTEGLTIFNLVDGVVDEFNDETGIDTAENVTATYDSSADVYTNRVGPNPIPAETGLTQITSTGPGTYTVEPTIVGLRVFAIAGGGAGGGAGYGSGGGAGGGAGGVVLSESLPVTGGSSIAYDVGAGGEGHFQPNHPSYPNPNVSAPWRPVEWPVYGPFTGGPGGATVPQGGTRSKPGNDTTFGPTITAEGGGSGGHGYTVNEPSFDPLFPGLEYTDGAPGGSGGGGGYSEGNVGEGETGENRHPAGELAQQGFDGGLENPGANYGGGGGGGAGAVGVNAGTPPSPGGGQGGAGIQVGPANPQLNWFPVGYGHPDGYVAGGGGGGSYAPGAKVEGGAGGGGDGSHSPGPTTSPAAASRGEDGFANTGGGGGSFAGGPGGSYADHRGGLGGSGMLVIAETEEFVSNTSMTIISDTFTANSVPNTARIVLFAELPDGLSDFSISATRDNTTFDAITLTDTGFVSGSSGTKIYTGSTPLTGTASPQVQLRWKIVGSSLSNKNNIHGVSLQWA